MKFISWNVNGLRAIVKKNFLEAFETFDADFFCLQETKLQAGQIELDLPGYTQYWNYAEKKGYILYGIWIDSVGYSQCGRVETWDPFGKTYCTVWMSNFFFLPEGNSMNFKNWESWFLEIKNKYKKNQRGKKSKRNSREG